MPAPKKAHTTFMKPKFSAAAALAKPKFSAAAALAGARAKQAASSCSAPGVDSTEESGEDVNLMAGTEASSSTDPSSLADQPGVRSTWIMPHHRRVHVICFCADSDADEGVHRLAIPLGIISSSEELLSAIQQRAPSRLLGLQIFSQDGVLVEASEQGDELEQMLAMTARRLVG